MATLSSPGVGSGIDIKGIVDKLMTVERRPLGQLDAKIQTLKAGTSAYGQLKSAVTSFRDAVAALSDPAKFKANAAVSSDSTVLTASAEASAAKGIYNVEVLRLAENHRMAAGTTYANTDTATLGSAGDTMTLGVGTESFTVTIGGKTLGEVRDAINGATSNTGVTASILKDDVGYRLVVSANDTGSAHALSASYSGSDVLSLQTLNQDRNASGGFTPADLDAAVKLENNFTVTSSTNTLTGTIEGVTLTLAKAGSSKVQVNRDTGSVQTAVQTFTKAYSGLVQVLGKLRGDSLKTDSPSLLAIQAQLRAVMNDSALPGNTFENPFQVGISSQKDGTLSVNASTLGSAINNDFEAFAKLFADPEQGLAVRMKSLADSLLATGGALDGRSQSLDSQVRDAQSQRARLTQRLTLVEARLTKTYNNLDSLVSSLQGTGNALTQQLTGLTNLSKQISGG